MHIWNLERCKLKALANRLILMIKLRVLTLIAPDLPNGRAVRGAKNQFWPGLANLQEQKRQVMLGFASNRLGDRCLLVINGRQVNILLGALFELRSSLRMVVNAK